MAARKELGTFGSTLIKAVPVVLIGVFGITRLNAVFSPTPENRAVPDKAAQSMQERREAQAPVWASIRGAGEGIVAKMDEAGVKSGNIKKKARANATTMNQGEV